LGSRLVISVFDGHGGWQVAEKLRSSLPSFLAKSLQSNPDASVALPEAFRSADAEIREILGNAYSLGFTKLARVGACGLCVVVDDQKIYVANAGDCKGILATGGNVVALNTQLNANDPREQMKLRLAHPEEDDVVRCKRQWTEKEAGSWWSGAKEVVKYSGCYVKGLLQPTRAFGDLYLKEERFQTDFDRDRKFINSEKITFPYITADPEVSVFHRRPADEFLVIGSDGLWDELSDADAASIARAGLAKGATPEQVAADLAREVLVRAAKRASLRVEDLQRVQQGPKRRGIHDDISVIVVVLS
jgi:pyruvate dehydrogenase phosphatase